MIRIWRILPQKFPFQPLHIVLRIPPGLHLRFQPFTRRHRTLRQWRPCRLLPSAQASVPLAMRTLLLHLLQYYLTALTMQTMKRLPHC